MLMWIYAESAGAEVFECDRADEMMRSRRVRIEALGIFRNGNADLRRVSNAASRCDGRSFGVSSSLRCGTSSRSIALAPAIPASNVMSWQFGRVAGLPRTANHANVWNSHNL